MSQENSNAAIAQNGLLGEERFIVVSSSLSAHCCFTHTVVDSAQGKEDYGDYWKHSVCECFEEEDAINVAKALNAFFA